MMALREHAYPIPEQSCERDGKCDQKALQIQAREAVTADAAFDVALGQLVASVLGVFGVIYTVVYARQAWKEAQRSADAAHEALEHARNDAAEQAERFRLQTELAQRAAASAAESAGAMQSVAASMDINAKQIVKSVSISNDIAKTQRTVSEMQLRAYLSVVISGATFQERPRLKFEGRPLLVNSGQTPAHKVKFVSKAAILPVPLPPEAVLSLPANDDVLEGMIPPNQNRTMSAVVDDFIPDEQVLSTMLGDNQALYMWGVVTYEDAFEHQRRTEFCHVVMFSQSAAEDPWKVHGYYVAGRNTAT
jgi:hypothetical protein